MTKVESEEVWLIINHLMNQGFKVRKFGRLGLLRVIDNKPQGLCIATH